MENCNMEGEGKDEMDDKEIMAFIEEYCYPNKPGDGW